MIRTCDSPLTDDNYSFSQIRTKKRLIYRSKVAASVSKNNEVAYCNWSTYNYIGTSVELVQRVKMSIKRNEVQFFTVSCVRVKLLTYTTINCTEIKWTIETTALNNVQFPSWKMYRKCSQPTYHCKPYDRNTWQFWCSKLKYSYFKTAMSVVAKCSVFVSCIMTGYLIMQFWIFW